ncbi:hypothetical protein MT997_28355 [Paenibacillus sp. OVF10]|nr:hypothetical protein MT997_28355 [Paenibacillus sp. OVF10]
MDEARLALHSQIRSTDGVQKIVKTAINSYKPFLLKNNLADTNLFIFGHEKGIGFIRHLVWNSSDNFDVTNYSPRSIVSDGLLSENSIGIAQLLFEEAKLPLGAFN